MKPWFVYSITNRVTGRQFIAIHASKDLLFATPGHPLEGVSGYDQLLTAKQLPAFLHGDIDRYGLPNFWIKSIEAAPNRFAANRVRRRVLSELRAADQPLYNRPRGGDAYAKAKANGSYRPNVTNNPGRRFRKRISATMKQIHREHPRRRDASGRFVRGWSYQKATEQSRGTVLSETASKQDPSWLE